MKKPLEIGKILTISTRHIDKSDDEKLRMNVYTPCGVFFDLTPPGEEEGYGYLVHCSEDFDDQNSSNHGELKKYMEEAGWSAAMSDIQIFALKHGCDYIRLDPDAETVEGLSTYWWFKETL